jgi:uncharacterized membrane protein
MSEHDPQPTVTDQIRFLQDQMNALAGRLASLEQRLLSGEAGPASRLGTLRPETHESLAPPAFAAPWHSPPPAASPESADEPAAPRPPHPPEAPRPEPAFDLSPPIEMSGGTDEARPEPEPTRGSSFPMGAQQWETLIGGKWALWVGSVAVFFAMAFFLAYAWRYLGNGGRLAVGFLAGLAFLGAGRWARERVEAWFGEGLTGGGLAILYLSIWAGAQRYGLLSFDLAFGLMAVVTAAGVALAVDYDAVSLSALATLGGFLTPVLLRAHGGAGSSSLSFLSYIAVLNAGILAVSLFKRWQGVIWLSFIATLLLMLGWAEDSYSPALRWVVFAFVSVYFLLFLGAACFYSLIHQEPTRQEDLLLLFADALAYAMAGHALLEGALGRYPGVFGLALAFGFALLSLAARALAPENRTLGSSAGGLSLFFLTIAIPIQLEQGWVSVGWSVEAAVLLTLGARLPARLLRRAGQIVWVFSLVSLLPVLADAQPVPQLLFLNARALPLLVSALGSAWMAVVSHSGRPGVAGESGRRDDLAHAYAAAAVLIGAWLIAQETYQGFEWHSAAALAAWRSRALFTLAIFWALYSLAVYAMGLQLRRPGFRLSALLVAAMASVLPMGAGLSTAAIEGTPFWNLRWLSSVVVALTLAILGWLISREGEVIEPSERQLAGIVPVGVSLVALCGMSLEIYASFRWSKMPSRESWPTAAIFALTVFWSVSALALLELGLAWKQARLRGLAYLLGGLAGVVLLFNSLDPAAEGWPPVLNLRLLAFGVVTVVLAMAPWRIGRGAPEVGAMEREVTRSAGWLFLPILVALWGLTQETYETFRSLSGLFGEQWNRAAQMGISLVWTLAGVLLLIGGAVRQRQPVRLLALGLMGLTAIKVFLFDLGFLDTSYRILSFGGLGLALIGISWLYSRYGQLRA